MNPFTAANPIFKSVEQFNIPSNSNFRDTEFFSKKQHTASLASLYLRHEDEPDFDCEFLPSISQSFADKENITELEQEDDLTDSYGDNQWDADIYDPYLESTYY